MQKLRAESQTLTVVSDDADNTEGTNLYKYRSSRSIWKLILHEQDSVLAALCSWTFFHVQWNLIVINNGQGTGKICLRYQGFDSLYSDSFPYSLHSLHISIKFVVLLQNKHTSLC